MKSASVPFLLCFFAVQTVLAVWLSTAIAVAQSTAPVSPAGQGAAAVDPNDKIAQEIADTTMSPFCPGRTISACPSGQAWELRKQILRWLNEGQSPEAVRQQLLTLYGEDVRGTPRPSAFGKLGWLMPGIFVLLGVVAIGIALKRQKTPRMTADPSAVDDSVRERIENELKRRSL